MTHNWRAYETCMCGEPGCGSFRPNGGLSIREMQEEFPEPLGERPEL